MKQSIFLTPVLLLFILANWQTINAQTSSSTQEMLQTNMNKLVYSFLKDSDSNENAIRKIQLYKKWASDMNELLYINSNEILHFEGIVWSVDFDNETEGLILRIGIA